MEDSFIETFNYRGFSIPIYNDDSGQQFYCILDGEEIGFGSFNTKYREDLKYLIDEKLDVIHYFDEPYQGAQLRWFDNGFSDRDIVLTYRTRAIKLFLVEDPEKVKIDKLIEQSKGYLDKYIKTKGN